MMENIKAAHIWCENIVYLILKCVSVQLLCVDNKYFGISVLIFVKLRCFQRAELNGFQVGSQFVG